MCHDLLVSHLIWTYLSYLIIIDWTTLDRQKRLCICNETLRVREFKFAWLLSDILPKWAGIKMATAHDACVLISCSCPTVGLNTVTRFNDLWESGMLGYVSEMALQTWSAFVWHRCYCRPDLDVCFWNFAEGLNVSKSKPFAVCPFATCELQFGSIKKRSKHLAPFNCCDHAVLAHPCRSDMWSLWSNCRKVIKSVNLQILHVFALLCCVLLYFRGNLDFCVISDRHLAWCSCALFRFLFQVQREAEEIYRMGWP